MRPWYMQREGQASFCLQEVMGMHDLICHRPDLKKEFTINLEIAYVIML